MRTVLIPAVLAMGCEAWPRHAHLPDPGPTLEANVDPRDLVPTTWDDRVEDGVDQPPGASLGTLEPGTGWLIRGQLDGAGWDDLAEPELIEGPECGSSATRAPIDGDYRADVDAWALDLSEPGRLCVEAQVGDTSTGIDLLIAPLDACDVPVGWLIDPDDGAPLGLADTGPAPGWWVDVTGAGRLSILIAGYAPNLTTPLPYRLAISLRPASDPLCGTPPSEGAQ